MDVIIKQIEEEKSRLKEGRLFKWLDNEEIDGRTRLSFTPAMLYYLMGFKDILAALKRPVEESKLDKYINAYCGEDAEHWRWYLTDLDKLNYGLQSWGSTIPAFCNEVWSEDTEPNRRTIFRLIHSAMSSTDPLYALSLIMVFEATGVVFIGHTRKAAIALGMDDELQYFGKEHYEEEFGHSVQARHIASYEICDDLYALTTATVSDLFADYRALFDCWHDHVGRYAELGCSAG